MIDLDLLQIYSTAVQITDLQEMQNHMREAVDAGLAQLHDKQGGGLPLIPVSAQAPPVKAGFMADAPPPDPNVAAEINQQMPPAQAQVMIGQTIDEVTAALGPPLTKADLGLQEIYFYKDRKVSFKDGKVSGVVTLGEKF